MPSSGANHLKWTTEVGKITQGNPPLTTSLVATDSSESWGTIPSQYLLRALPGSNDSSGTMVTRKTLVKLSRSHKATWSHESGRGKVGVDRDGKEIREGRKREIEGGERLIHLSNPYFSWILLVTSSSLNYESSIHRGLILLFINMFFKFLL